MRVEMVMPDLSTTGTTVKIISWLVEPGDSVERGQPVVEVETDKASMDVEAAVEGVLSGILAPADTEVEVGAAIAVFDTPDEASPTTRPDASREDAVADRAIDLPGSDTPAATPSAPKPGGMFARNRQRAAEAIPQTAPAPVPTEIGWTANQRVSAQRMQESKTTIPHFYLQYSANAGPMSARRSRAAGEKPAWDAFFVSAAGRALRKFPRMCIRIQDGVPAPSNVDAVGVAVDLDGDLYVISIGEPAAKTPEAISAEIRTQAQRLKEGDPEARKMRENNLTISNLGATGVESFTAIINPPEASILAVGKVAPAVVAVDGQVKIQDRVTLTLSVDHRITSGRYAAEFLGEIIRELEAL